MHIHTYYIIHDIKIWSVNKGLSKSTCNPQPAPPDPIAQQPNSGPDSKNPTLAGQVSDLYL